MSAQPQRQPKGKKGKQAADRRRLFMFAGATLLVLLLYLRSRGSAGSTALQPANSSLSPSWDPTTGSWIDPTTGLPISGPASSGGGTGAQGPAGQTGAQGPAGKRGARGARGKPGKPAPKPHHHTPKHHHQPPKEPKKRHHTKPAHHHTHPAPRPHVNPKAGHRGPAAG